MSKKRSLIEHDKALVEKLAKKMKFEEFGLVNSQDAITPEVIEHLDVIKEVVVKEKDSISKGEWLNGEVKIITQRGKMIASMGHWNDQIMYLYPEEATYLVGKGLLYVLYDGKTLTYQAIFELMLDSNVSFGFFNVYNELRNIGYVPCRYREIDIPTVTKPVNNDLPYRGWYKVWSDYEIKKNSTVSLMPWIKRMLPDPPKLNKDLLVFAPGTKKKNTLPLFSVVIVHESDVFPFQSYPSEKVYYASICGDSVSFFHIQ